MSEHLTILELDSLAEAEAVSSSPHLDSCERCQRELTLMRAARERFQRGVFARTAPEIERKLAQRSSPWRSWGWVSPLVLVPALAVLLVTLGPPRPSQPRLGSVGIKGAATLRVFARHNETVSGVRDGAELGPGDALRFEIQPGGFPYLLVGSVDGAGGFGILFPMDKAESGRIDPVAAFVLPGSAVLDESPGPERVFALLSARPIPTEEAQAAMRELARGGPSALREATSLPKVSADAQLSVLWEKRVP